MLIRAKKGVGITQDKIDMKLEIKIPDRKMLIGLVVGIAVLIVVILFRGPYLILFFQTSFLPFSHNWEAVYMINGDVYVGKIIGTTSTEIGLKNTYLLKISKQNENDSGGKTDTFKLSGVSNNLTLIKWGFKQPLKSEGKLFISRFNIAFWEKLDNDSEVVKQLETTK